MASLKSFHAEAKAEQHNITTGALGKQSFSAKGHLHAELPEGVRAKLTITDKTITSVRAAQRGGAAAIGARAARGRATPLREARGKNVLHALADMRAPRARSWPRRCLRSRRAPPWS